MRENEKRDMIITIDGRYLDDRLTQKLEFEGAGLLYGSSVRNPSKEVSKPFYAIYSSSSQPDVLDNFNISLGALQYASISKNARGSNWPVLAFMKAEIGFYNYDILERLRKKLSNPSLLPHYELLVERMRGTCNRTYHRGDSSLLKQVGVRILLKQVGVRRKIIAEREKIGWERRELDRQREHLLHDY